MGVVEVQSAIRRQLGDMVEGSLTPEQLEEAIAEQHRSSKPLGQVLVELGLASAGAIANALAEQHGGLLKTEFGISAGLHPPRRRRHPPSPSRSCAPWPRLRSSGSSGFTTSSTRCAISAWLYAAASLCSSPSSSACAIPCSYRRQMAIDPRVDIGHVHLKVADIERALEFYVGVLGFELQQRMREEAAFVSAGGYHHHIGLNTWQSRGASPPPPGHTGLFHVAIRYPDRPSLADALRRLVAAGHPLSGASDHGVSEAIYLADPDGNGIELYRDRPESEWPRNADGTVAMFSNPLDLDALLAEAPDAWGYMEGPAAEEAERRLDELERGPERTTEERLAVFGSTAEDPEKHFIGWRDDIDPDELFASGRFGRLDS